MAKRKRALIASRHRRMGLYPSRKVSRAERNDVGSSVRSSSSTGRPGVMMAKPDPTGLCSRYAADVRVAEGAVRELGLKVAPWVRWPAARSLPCLCVFARSLTQLLICSRPSSRNAGSSRCSSQSEPCPWSWGRRLTLSLRPVRTAGSGSPELGWVAAVMNPCCAERMIVKMNWWKDPSRMPSRTRTRRGS